VARYVDVIDVPVPIEQAFDYLADFSRTADWDPGVSDAERLGSGPIGSGSRFRVVVSFLGQSLPIEYEIATYERPTRLVLRGGDDGFRSIDEITFAARGRGTRVTYEARLELSGIRRLADPLLDRVFQRIGRRAARGLREGVTSHARAQANRPRRSARAVARQKRRA
jgi:dehydrogenase/reductase SDR family protein 12